MTASGDPLEVSLNGRAVPLRIRRDSRAKRLVLRIDAAIDGAVVTVPKDLSDAAATAFVESRADWVLDHLDRLPVRVPFADGARVPVLGREHRIRHLPGARGGAWLEDGEIRVSGRAEHLPRRVADRLKTEARREISDRAAEKCARLGLDHGRITLRDTRSRWGSCAANGDLSFCWRLILAPEAALDYVVAHEVAHLRHRGHGPDFHALVATLTPGFEAGRRWLRDNGFLLRRYG